MWFSVSSCEAQVETYSPMFKCSKKLDNPYGICTHINRTGERWEYDTRDVNLKMVNETGASWIRADFDWTSLQKRMKGAYSYNFYDDMMKSVKDSHKNLFGLLVPPQRRDQYKEWETYVDNTVSRYKKNVKYWEVINEADIRYKNPVWSWFTANDYVDLLKRGCKTIKIQDKKSKILFSGIANTDTKFVDSVFRAGVSDYFDIMTVHRYCHKGVEPEILLDYFSRLNNKLNKYNIDKPVWLTECGTSTAVGWATEEAQAKRLPRIFLVSFACGIDKVFYYKSRSCELDAKELEDHFGLWHKDYTPKPAFYAYQTLTKMCPDKSVRPTLRREGGVYIAQWKRPDGKKAYALWTSKENETVELTIKGAFDCYDINGKKLSLMTHEIEVSPSILYFIGNRKFELSVKE